LDGGEFDVVKLSLTENDSGYKDYKIKLGHREQYDFEEGSTPLRIDHKQEYEGLTDGIIQESFWDALEVDKVHKNSDLASYAP
jgi:hypothetical protein